jgi:hypothetical protein
MKRSHVIALDAHCKFTEIGVLTPAGRMSKRGQVTVGGVNFGAFTEKVGK